MKCSRSIDTLNERMDIQNIQRIAYNIERLVGFPFNIFGEDRVLQMCSRPRIIGGERFSWNRRDEYFRTCGHVVCCKVSTGRRRVLIFRD